MRIRPAIVIRDKDTILMMRYSYSGKDVFQFPGGNMEDVETLEQTLARELKEELNLPVSVEHLLLSAQVINHKKQQATLHCLFAGSTLQSARPVLNPQETSALEVVWINIDQLDQLNLYPSVGNALKEILLHNKATPQYLGAIEQPWF
jgi:ADP-ribose pyrophosphatase YjhB (NUDIX family)